MSDISVAVGPVMFGAPAHSVFHVSISRTYLFCKIIILKICMCLGITNTLLCNVRVVCF